MNTSGMKDLNHSLKEEYAFNLEYSLKHRMLVKANFDGIKEDDRKNEYELEMG
jgi:hypothetical protein